ncbi:COX15/CtaA family protein [Alicyclobacillus tolerans]|uniref:COX15/CtaA family protein n=1 Tax=Alicyclobacillus tolerans TaxID=90970 RepID=UPI001F02B8F7|nr:COX15/CtaA family protein [Alicyclobacillus tolerans]MCF8564050.1 COX15/CtaA family protein [Alicyclobacillus tolerans]
MTYRLPLISTLAIAVQMVLGGIVVGENAGFVCPDWPLCDGQVLPKLSGMVILELVHRFSAVAVTVLVIWVAVLAWRRARQERAVVWLASFGVVSLFLQVIVGGLIVILTLPGVTTTIDVANSMVLLGLYVALTLVTHRREKVNRGEQLDSDRALYSLAAPAWSVWGVSFFAILAGAVFRHTGASQALYGQNSYLASHGQHDIPSLALSKGLLMFHVSTGILVAAAALWFLLSAIRAKRLVPLAWAQVVLVAFQAGFGVWSLGSQLALLPATLHWSNAAFLLGVLTWAGVTAQLAKYGLEPVADSVRRTPMRNPGTVS